MDIDEAEIEVLCPECEGRNLTEDQTKCWDCMAMDYVESYMETEE